MWSSGEEPPDAGPREVIYTGGIEDDGYNDAGGHYKDGEDNGNEEQNQSEDPAPPLSSPEPHSGSSRCSSEDKAVHSEVAR